MSTMNFAETEAVNEDGVTITRSSVGLSVCLPRPVSTSHELRIVAVLWEAWITARNDVCVGNMKWTIDVRQLDEITLPLIAIMSAIDADLTQAGRKPLVVGSAHVRSFPVSSAFRGRSAAASRGLL